MYLRSYLPTTQNSSGSKLAFYETGETEKIVEDLEAIYNHTIRYLVAGGFFFFYGVVAALWMIWQPTVNFIPVIAGFILIAVVGAGIYFLFGPFKPSAKPSITESQHNNELQSQPAES